MKKRRLTVREKRWVERLRDLGDAAHAAADRVREARFGGDVETLRAHADQLFLEIVCEVLQERPNLQKRSPHKRHTLNAPPVNTLSDSFKQT